MYELGCIYLFIYLQHWGLKLGLDRARPGLTPQPFCLYSVSEIESCYLFWDLP
jgi:hypothetical protein